MDILQGFADISLWELILVAAVALLASIVGGVTGYGSSALMPLVLVPLIGPEPVVPIVSISGLFNNVTRAYAFREYIDFRRGTIIMVAAVPTCMLGAYTYTKLTSAGILIAIGAMLCLSVPFSSLGRSHENAVELGRFGRGFGALWLPRRQHHRFRRCPAVGTDGFGPCGCRVVATMRWFRSPSRSASFTFWCVGRDDRPGYRLRPADRACGLARCVSCQGFSSGCPCMCTPASSTALSCSAAQ